ncbi:CaiB/BaiF CoA transferase family protein [Paraglaciecola chathamensis]|uniref:L-carnitine dehydratase/bile acid-inducible protein F n=1 Tax=Paraglaciecola chathamensis S18K6 TaxID=1127672 RepID=A0AAV3V1S6_9ALTE|nr:CoA transferase [Paraglaciecola chathamensis]GAC11026.1 L-carnitine dehydratase/bile acid-inducible protein F [Paraglaciecola chathamensis S18K6]
MTQLPLDGVRIIAVEQYGAGPYGSMYLADLGAEVIKIENPAIGGDVSRQTGPFFIGENDSYFYQTFNVNKKSLTLNLKSEEGRKVFEELVRTADAVTNNLRGDQPQKLGITYEQLKQVNPKIVCGHLSAYGRDNDRASWPGYDYLMQAEAGLMSLTGEPDQAPTRFGVSMVDFMTGAVASLGLTAGILGAHRTGQGRDVDVSLFDVALHQLSYPATWYLNEQHVVQRVARSAHPATVPCQLYKTQDSFVFLMAMTDKFWDVLVDILDDEVLKEDRFAQVAGRRENRDVLTTEIDRVLATHPTAHWLEVLKGRIPCAPVYDVPEALNNQYIRDIGMVQSVPHPHNQDMEILANPIKLDGQRLSGKAAVAMGNDTEILLKELGYSEQEITHLSQNNVV